jgi:hypothetical protein
MKAAFKYLTSLLFVAIVIQVGVAAVGVFKALDYAKAHQSITHDQIDNGFDPHHIFGTIVAALILILFILAFAAGMEPVMQKIAAALLALMALQFLFAFLAEKSPWLGFLHGMNALAIYGAAAVLAHRAWTRKEPAPA